MFFCSDLILFFFFFFFSSRRRHTRLVSDWSSDVCSSDLMLEHSRAIFDRFRDAVKDQRYRGFDRFATHNALQGDRQQLRSEERRVGKECRSWWSPGHEKKKEEEWTK